MKYLLASCLVLAVFTVDVFCQGKVCEPDSVDEGACGPCTCLPDGSGRVCVNAKCDPILGSGIPSGRRIARAVGGRCIPGQTFQMDCNTCVCPDSGIAANAACTLIACPPSTPAPSRYYRRYTPRFYRW